MKRRYKLLLGLLFTLLSLFVIIFSVSYYQTRQKSANIFDEMYYDESSFVTRFSLLGQTHLGTVSGIESIKRGKTAEGVEIYEAANMIEKYKTVSSPLASLELDFYIPPSSTYKNGYLKINIGYQLENGDTINILYGYHPKKKVLTRQIVKNYWKDGYSEDKSTILQTLKENHLSLQDAYDYGNKILKTKVLKDWTSVYPSRFSLNDWGDVKLVDKWSDE